MVLIFQHLHLVMQLTDLLLTLRMQQRQLIIAIPHICHHSIIFLLQQPQFGVQLLHLSLLLDDLPFKPGYLVVVLDDGGALGDGVFLLGGDVFQDDFRFSW